MSLLGPNLDAFLAIVKKRTVQSAASEVGITQTGVTQRIRALEAQLEATLFTRSRRGMSLTPEGEALLRYCQSALDLQGETLARIKGGGERFEARVTIQGPTSLMRTRVIPRCLEALKGFPELSMTFKVSDHESGADALRSGAAQFAILRPDEVAREMDSKLLAPERYLLLGPSAWKRRPLKDVVARERIIDFDPTDGTTLSWLKKLKLHPLARPERHFVNNNEALVAMLKLGLGYGVLTREFAEPHLKLGEIADLSPGVSLENRLALAWFPRPRPAGYFEAIIRAVH